MKKTLLDLIKLLLPLNEEKKHALIMASPYIVDHDQRQLKQYLKLDRTFPVIQKFHTSKSLFEDKEWPFFKTHLHDDELHKFLSMINDEIAGKARHEAFLKFAPHALDRISLHIAHNIVGMNEHKRAAAVQLFAKEPVHVLLIGDPGTGKTDILRSVHKIAPVSSFGLGSGTSNAGLGATAQGKEIVKGLLPMADNGIACIDELNLMKAKDMAALYNAMEKGFVTFDKGGRHEQLPARVRVIATANPDGDTFIAKTIEGLRKQIPFEDALLSRFHFVFIVRKPTEEEFRQIAAKIVKDDNLELSKEDMQFIKDYVEFALNIDVNIDEHLEHEIVNFITSLKHDERKFLMEIAPRTVVGVVRIVKAVARAELAQSVDKEHLETAFNLMRAALYVRKDDDKEEKAEKKKKNEDKQ